MKSIICVLLLSIIALAIAQEPKKPMWPDAFSATVVRRTNNGMHFSRWFYDFKNLRDRFDGFAEWHGEFYFAEQIFKHTEGFDYTVYYRDSEVTCIKNKINSTMIKPDFSNFRFAGISLVNYQQCYHWVANDTRRDFFQFWDRVSDREPVRFDVINRFRQEEQFTFTEFDVGAQDQGLFDVPPIIKDSCFTPGKKF